MAGHQDIRGKAVGLPFVNGAYLRIVDFGSDSAIGSVIAHSLTQKIPVVNIVAKLMSSGEALASFGVVCIYDNPIAAVGTLNVP